MALNKIVLSDGVTELANVKSVAYKEVVNAGVGLRPGCVGSAQIEVEVYGNQAGAVAAGEVVRYYQIDAGGNETLMGLFTAEPSIETKNSYKFLAYDNAQKLDADFSQWLRAHQEDFPLTVYALVSAACTVAGVTLGSESWPLSTQTVNAFYADGITCRDILSYAAEIACKFVRCHTGGAVYFDWYAATANTIAPSAGTNQYAYKQNGLTYANYTAESLARVAVHPSGEDDVAYIYPDGVTSGNTIHIKNNLLLTAADAAFYNAVAQNVYSNISTLFPYRPFSVRLFPGENPFRAGMVVSAVDIQGVQFSAPVMSMSVTSAAAELESTGNVTLEDSEVTAKELVQLASDIVRINKLKVDWADINQAIINYLTANNVTAQNLTIVDENGNVLATFDENGVRIGGEGSAYVSMDGTGFAAYDRGGSKSFEVRMDGVVHPTVMDRSMAAKGRNISFNLPQPTDGRYWADLGSVTMDISDLSSGLPIIDYNMANLNCSRVEFDLDFENESYYGYFINTFYSSNAKEGKLPAKPTPVPDGQVVPQSGSAERAMFVDLDGAGLSGSVTSKIWLNFVPEGGSAPLITEALLIEAVSNYSGTSITFSATASFSDELNEYIKSVAEQAYPTIPPLLIYLENVRTVLDAHYDASTYAPSLTYGTASGWRGDYSSTFGTDLIAVGDEQTVFGRANVEDTDGVYALIVGNGTDDSDRSNALTLDWNGNEVLAGGLTIEGNRDIGAELDGMKFRDVTPTTADLLETLCPWEATGKLSLYLVTGGLISDAPLTNTATAYVACIGYSAAHHIHVLMYTSSSNIGGRTFIRQTRNSSPLAWREVVTSNTSAFYGANDTVSIGKLVWPGMVTGSTKSLYLNVSVDKSLEFISTVTVTGLTGTIRGPSGYVDNSGDKDWTSGEYSATATKVTNHQIQINIAKSSAFSGVANNVAVSYWGTVGLRFT